MAAVIRQIELELYVGLLVLYSEPAVRNFITFIFNYFAIPAKFGTGRDESSLRNVTGTLVQLVQTVLNLVITTIKWSFREVGLRLVQTGTKASGVLVITPTRVRCIKQCLYFVLLICFGLATVKAQVETQSLLMDQFGKISCEDFKARIQNLYTHLASNPNARAYIVISGNSTDAYKNLSYEKWLFGEIKALNLDDSLITEIRGSEVGPIKIQFWVVPPGATLPKFNEGTWNFKLSTSRKPKFLYSDSQNILCMSGHFEQILKDYLQANEGWNGRIVISARSWESYRSRRMELLRSLSDVESKRIRFLYVRVKSEFEEDTQWWLIPPTTKRN